MSVDSVTSRVRLCKTVPAPGWRLGHPAIKTPTAQLNTLPEWGSRRLNWGLSVQNTGRFDYFLPDSSPGFWNLLLRRPEIAPALEFVEWAGGGVVNLSHPIFPLSDVCVLTLLSTPGPSVFYRRSGWERCSSVLLLGWNSPWTHCQPNRK